jgi:hypothetical protein
LIAGLVGERLLLTLWVGSLWAIGYITAPFAFIYFEDIEVAGTFVGKLFIIVNYIGLACGSALVIRYASLGQHAMTLWRFWVTVTMLLLVVFIHFYLQVEMSVIKSLDWRQNSALSDQFDLLHHISTVVYTLLSILGLALVATQDNMITKAER